MNIDYASFVLAHAAHARLHANPAPPQPWSFLLFWQWKWHLCGSYDIVITVLPQWPFHFAIEFRAYDDVQRFSVTKYSDTLVATSGHQVKSALPMAR